jgi:hypothetical protein
VCVCVCVVAVRHVIQVFIDVVYGVLYGSVCVANRGLCSPGCGRGVCVCVCVVGVRGGGLRCWGMCVFVIESLRRLWVFSVVVRLKSGNGGVV